MYLICMYLICIYLICMYLICMYISERHRSNVFGNIFQMLPNTLLLCLSFIDIYTYCSARYKWVNFHIIKISLHARLFFEHCLIVMQYLMSNFPCHCLKTYKHFNNLTFIFTKRTIYEISAAYLRLLSARMFG